MSFIDRRLFKFNLAISGIANEPAANPVIGTQYIVGASATGSFSGVNANYLARYNGTNWEFTPPKAGGLEVLNVNTGEILSFNGTNWVVIASLGDKNIKPVLDIIATGSTLPVTAFTGDKFLKIDDAKIYNAIADDIWDDGVITSNGDRYASSTDHKIYTSNGSALTAANVPDGSIFFNKADSQIYAYNATTGTFIKASSSSGGGVSSEIITETHTLTAAEITAKEFALSNAIASGKENSVIVFVQGIAQIASTDFTASASSISWTNKALDDFGFTAGDVLIIQYQKS